MKKNPWVAAFLNFLLPGLGYIYSGTKRKLFACNANIAIGLPSHSMGDADKYSTAAADYVAFKYKIDQQVFICGIAIEVFHDPLLLTSQPMSDNGIPDGNIDLF